MRRQFDKHEVEITRDSFGGLKISLFEIEGNKQVGETQNVNFTAIDVSDPEPKQSA